MNKTILILLAIFLYYMTQLTMHITTIIKLYDMALGLNTIAIFVLSYIALQNEQPKQTD